MDDVNKGLAIDFPRCLQNKHFDGDDVKVKGQFYKYPHDYPNHWTEQQYMPDALKGKVYYRYGDNKQEQSAKMYWDKIKMIKKIVSYIGIAGILSIIILSIFDRLFFISKKVFAVWLVISVILLLPILIRELLSLRKKNKD